jgi:hypothetical protein
VFELKSAIVVTYDELKVAEIIIESIGMQFIPAIIIGSV